jgi:Lamin Tail Domain/Carboxypeptidase regulatory-like domain
MKSVLFLVFAIILFAAPAAYSQNSQSAKSFVSATVVINEVYGGAGCGTAGCSTYQNDFIELKNISLGNVNISGWSVQYTSATGSAWQVTPIPAGTVLRPGDTYLIAESFGANGANPLPAPNATGTIAMSATAAKVALVNNAVALSGTCPFPSAVIVDFIGYGATANCNDGQVNNAATNAAAPSTTTSAQRNGAGTDSDVNSTDFTSAAPTPQAALQPTAAGVSVSGRVATANGRGIGKVLVSMTDQTGQIRTALTSPFGYYQFTDIGAGETYTVSVSSKGYTFGEPTRFITLSDAVDDLNFIANE